MVGEISFRPTVGDHLAAHRAWFWRALLTRKFFGTVAAGIGCVTIIGVAITWSEPDRQVRLAVVGAMGLGFVAFMAVMTGLSFALQPRAARRIYDQYRALKRDFVFAWDEAGVRVSTSHGYSDLAWHDYHDAYDGRDVLLLMLNDRLFHFIPHRVLTADQLADLRAIAARAGEPAPA